MTLWRRRIDGLRVSSTLVFLSSLDIEFNLCFIPTKLLSGDDLFFFSDLLSTLTGDFSRPDCSLSFLRVWLLRSFFFLSFFRFDEVVLSSSPEEDLNPGLASSSETFRWRLCSIYTKHDDKLHYHCLVCHSSTINLLGDVAESGSPLRRCVEAGAGLRLPTVLVLICLGLSL